MDEISEFLGGILSQSTSQYVETPEASDAELKKKPKRRTEKLATMPGTSDPYQSAFGQPGSSVVPKRKSTHSSLAPPRKRIKSAPEDTKFSSSTNQAIQSAPELSGLLRGQRPIHEIKQEINMQNRLLKEGSALYSDLKAQLAAKASSHQALVGSASSHQGMVGSLTATSADIKAQLAAKAAAQQLAASLAATSHLNSVRQVSANTLTTVPSSDSMLSKQLQSSSENTLPTLASTLSSLHNALRTGYKPSVHITSASVTSQIQHLLTTVNRSTESLQSKPPKSLPTLLSSLKSQIISSPGSILDTTSSSHSVSSEASNSSNHSTTTQTETEKLQALQKLQFHDFPLTTASLIKFPNPPALSQTKILGSSNINKTHAQSDQVTCKGSQVESSGTMTVDMDQTSPPRQTRPAIISTVTEGNIVTVSLTSDKSIVHSSPSSTKTQLTGSGLNKSVVTSSIETLGKVNSLLESSPVIQRTSTNIVTPSSSQVGSYTVTKSFDITPKKSSATTTSHSGSVSSRSAKAASTAVTSYTATPKPALSTIAATRTRRIRTPKQYDL